MASDERKRMVARVSPHSAEAWEQLVRSQGGTFTSWIEVLGPLILDATTAPPASSVHKRSHMYATLARQTAEERSRRDIDLTEQGQATTRNQPEQHPTLRS